jgi:hypothetical protein
MPQQVPQMSPPGSGQRRRLDQIREPAGAARCRGEQLVPHPERIIQAAPICRQRLDSRHDLRPPAGHHRVPPAQLGRDPRGGHEPGKILPTDPFSRTYVEQPRRRIGDDEHVRHMLAASATTDPLRTLAS